MTAGRIGPNFAEQAVPQNLVQSCSLLGAWNQRIKRHEYTAAGLDQILPASCYRNFCHIGYGKEMTTRRIGPNFAEQAVPQNLVQSFPLLVAWSQKLQRTGYTAPGAGNNSREDWTKFCRTSCPPKFGPILSFACGLEPKAKENWIHSHRSRK